MDPRKAALKEGIRQLQRGEIQRLIEHVELGGLILLDRDDQGHANYSGGTYCPLAIGAGLHIWPRACQTDESVFSYLTKVLKFKVYNTRGIAGEFYTTNRRDDLLVAAREVLFERS